MISKHNYSNNPLKKYLEIRSSCCFIGRCTNRTEQVTEETRLGVKTGLHLSYFTLILVRVNI